MDEPTIKQCVGIDISKHTFTACMCSQATLGKEQFSQSVEFINDPDGFKKLLKWSRSSFSETGACIYLMEATGVYYEQLAYFLHEAKCTLSVVLPTRVKYFTKSLNVKTKTDAVDARVISLMGVQQNFENWRPPSAIYHQLRSLTRFYSDMLKERTKMKNHLEALASKYQPHPLVVKSYKKMIKDMEQVVEKTLSQIRELVETDAVLNAKFKLLETIPSVGFMTVAVIVAEASGFAMIRSRKQLASYAGLDVVERQSGSSVNGRTHISKKGNSRIRAALYFPALVAVRYNPEFKEDYARIISIARCKKIGVVALQRKILLLMYTLWKNNMAYVKQT